MKQLLNKNIGGQLGWTEERQALADDIAAVTKMQQQLTALCLQNNLTINGNAGVHEGKAFFQFAIGFANSDTPIFQGQASSGATEFFKQIKMLVNGDMVSEAFPPAEQYVTVINDFGKDQTEQVKIAYWKRCLITEQDITARGMKAMQKNETSRSCWIGYSTLGAELVRVLDGTANPDHAKVNTVGYMTLGNRGDCVMVWHHDAVEERRRALQAIREKEVEASASSLVSMDSASMLSASMVYDGGQYSAVETARANLDQTIAAVERGSSYARGVPTELGGYFTRHPLRETPSSITVTDGDCGVKSCTRVTINDDKDLQALVGKNYVKDGLVLPIGSDDTHLIGQTIDMRSIVLCQQEGDYAYCSVCMGDLNKIPPEIKAAINIVPKKKLLPREELEQAISAAQGSSPGALYMLAVKDGDCGTTETVEMRLDDEQDLNMLVGMNYMFYGKVQRITKNSVDLIGKTLQVRSPMLCLEKTHNTICRACLGDDSLLPQAASLFKRISNKNAETIVEKPGAGIGLVYSPGPGNPSDGRPNLCKETEPYPLKKDDE